MEKIAKKHKKKRFLSKFRDFCVLSPKNTHIEKGATIGKDCIIYPNCYIDKNCVIGENTTLFCGCILSSAKTGINCKLGPFLHARPNTILGNNVRLGNFCETKNATIGDNTKIAHLTYVGDADIGKNCNFGCGVVFANYDGNKKHKTIIGDNVFVGCNVNLIAPVTLKNNSFIAAGTTVTQDVAENTFVIGRPNIIEKSNKFTKN